MEQEYPYIKFARVESHSVHQGELYGKHALQIDFILNTGLVIEYDSTRRADGTPKKSKNSKTQKKAEEGSQCGNTAELKDGADVKDTECVKDAANDVKSPK